MELTSWILLFVLSLPAIYLFVLALSSIRPAPPASWQLHAPNTNFAIAIAAHNEEAVIGNTIQRLLQLDYPNQKFSIHVVADHCTDKTAIIAAQAGAVVHERNNGIRSGKGSALAWLFGQILQDDQLEAVIVFDADTRVDKNFLRAMDFRLVNGAQVIQGQHRISNYKTGWFPALTWAMFLIDNRYQNLGRSNLGWSAKHMGDSICFRSTVLRNLRIEEGLTEDYEFRQRLLLEGIKIEYEPAAIGLGEAPLTWQQARAQRARWLRGTNDARKKFGSRLLSEGLKTRDFALIDGAFQAYFPSYSTLVLLSVFILLMQLIAFWVAGPNSHPSLFAWIGFVLGLYLYPLLGLFLEKAPLRAYLVILTGPIFIVWRTLVALYARRKSKQITWIRTSHVGGK